MEQFGDRLIEKATPIELGRLMVCMVGLYVLSIAIAWVVGPKRIKGRFAEDE